jgi:hypothetical protein
MSDNWVDDTQGNARLQSARDGTMNGQRVPVAATGDEWPHNRVTIILDNQRAALVPRQPTVPFEAKLTTAQLSPHCVLSRRIPLVQSNLAGLVRSLDRIRQTCLLSAT